MFGGFGPTGFYDGIDSSGKYDPDILTRKDWLAIEAAIMDKCDFEARRKTIDATKKSALESLRKKALSRIKTLVKDQPVPLKIVFDNGKYFLNFGYRSKKAAIELNQYDSRGHNAPVFRVDVKQDTVLSKLMDEYERIKSNWDTDMAAIEKCRSTILRKIDAMVLHIRTFSQLEKIWPDGKDFYESLKKDRTGTDMADEAKALSDAIRECMETMPDPAQ